ncbi:hypothetical protein H310_11501 [Aphanomyces invadans]|uniref:Uncharacterized protein n=1 Tax=Aphanomyces invadans TaxID=157072 RepID=A0A024TL21_9STRA|nr:hypothetical protein H310_11501 [Aphanomyces invadans]ETV94835.1 hypothetical protein H310_11501 [Aphanomyces invadans]|eukprot:XP_008876426.1 hypothetical protein H310_11501 [Aphanomyces invadans]
MESRSHSWSMLERNTMSLAVLVQLVESWDHCAMKTWPSLPVRPSTQSSMPTKRRIFSPPLESQTTKYNTPVTQDQPSSVFNPRHTFQQAHEQAVVSVCISLSPRARAITELPRETCTDKQKHGELPLPIPDPNWEWMYSPLAPHF